MQRADRKLDHGLRLKNLALLDELRAQGFSRREVAKLLDLPERTLTDWDLKRQRGQLVPRPLGRTAHRAPVTTRNLTLSVLELFGPHVSVPTVRAFVDELVPAAERPTRREVEELVGRYREVYREQNLSLAKILDWTRPGAVWAMDFTEPPEPVDGRDRAILAVRDLASGYMLEALPVRAADAATVCAILQRLFHDHGAPLVMKSDLGSHFTAGAAQALLARYGVTWLPSPGYYPAYNGSIEASIRALKERAASFALAAGRLEWRHEDVEGARLLGNASPRRRLGDATPAQAWATRQPISAGLRVAFLASCRAGRQVAARQLGEFDLASLGKRDREAVEREVISRALVEHGFLLYRRRWVSPRVRRLKLAIIS